ncbi:HlyD family secretion protein [Clostridium sp. MCC353]|uniref:HlyD family efflux transporter periplasmic adaptor subunit n=1 Tax=Clostridium sp. MCC353 TaxID=2592646 RepID=UPI002079DC74|nr:HlyD family efflux transporter periplasmic adaptor subunit [Clostridium sp. MCC353]MBT9778791.1 HlyD family secretion protein [Clostridium sp. MCC353]
MDRNKTDRKKFDKEKIGVWCKKTLAIFLVSMVILTFLSRVMDAVTVAKVQTGLAGQGVVVYEFTGDGTYTADDMVYISLPEGMKVGKVEKQPGQEVKAGEGVLSLQMESLTEEKEALELELEKARILLEQERLSSSPIPRVTQETLALQAVEADQKALELGKQDLLEAKDEYAVKTADLKQEYQRKLGRSREEVKEDAKRTYKSARRSYETARISRDSAVKRAEREVSDKQKKLDKLIEKDEPEEDIADAELELARAEEDLEEIKEEQDVLVEEARARMYAAEEDYEDVDYGSEEAKEELRKNYETAVEAEEDKLKEAERKVNSLEEALYQSMQKLENARVSDAGTMAEEQAQKEASRLRQRSMELDIREIEKKLEKINGLIGQEGMIFALTDGIIVDSELKDGELISQGKQIKMACGALLLKARINKEDAKLIKPGLKMTVKNPGEQKGIEAEIGMVNQMTGSDEAEITAVMQEGQGVLGGNAGFKIRMESGPYPTVIPIEALREDSTGYFCLAAEPKKTILGEELTAVRIHLEVLEMSSTSAAVSGAISPETKLIISGNKTVGEGDRVRVVTQ